MDIKNINQKYLIPIIGLFLLNLIFFYPQLQNKTIQQHDIQAFRAMSQELRDHHEKTGERTYWTNSMFGGMPTYQITSFQPTNLLRYVDKLGHLFIQRPIGLFFLIMLSAYLSLIFLGVDRWVSFFGASVIGLSACNFILYGAGHTSKIKVAAYCLPLVIGMYTAYKKNLIGGVALFGLSLGLGLFAGHPQMLYYLGFTLIAMGVILLVDAIKKNELPNFLKATGGLLIVGLIALASSASSIMPTMEYTEDTMRGKPILTQTSDADSKSSTVEGLDWIYATNWSNGFMDVVAGFIPGVVGGSNNEPAPTGSVYAKKLRKPTSELNLPLYWGAMSSTGGAFYFGALLIWLLFIQLAIGNRTMSIWLSVSLVVLFILSMGRNMEWFNRILFDYFPMFNKFRAPNSVSAVISPIIGLGASLGLSAIIKHDWKKENIKKILLYTAGPLIAITLFFILMGGSFFSFEHASDPAYVQRGFDQAILIEDRKILMKNDAIRSLIFVLLGCVAIYFYALGNIKKYALIAIISVFALIDIVGVGRRYLSNDRFVPKRNTTIKKRPVDEQILRLEKSRGDYRVYDLSINTFNDANTSYWHNTVGGYNAAKLQRFEDIKNNLLYKGNQGVLNMLNTKYIISRDQKVQQNPGALGTAWFVNEINIVDSNDDEINALKTINPKTTAAIHKEFNAYLNGFDPDGQGSISLQSYAPNKLVYKSKAASDQLAIFSEIWYGPNKGWSATIDGKSTNFIRANYILRGLKVPAGEHEIVFSFHPQTVKLGNTITLISSGLLILLVGFFIYQFISTYQPPKQLESENITKKPKKAKVKRRKK